MEPKNIHFITGRLAQHALRKTLQSLAPKANFSFSIQVLPITVAALMTPAWIASRLDIPPEATHLCLPGYCDGDLDAITSVTALPILVGPKDLRELPQFFGEKAPNIGLQNWDIDILAEINHAPRLSIDQLVATANQLRRDGATLIDVGCEPNSCWSQVGDYVAALKSAGHRVSIDSLNPKEIAPAVAAGAELVLSVNHTNRESAADWGCEVVVIPDDIQSIDSMESTIEFLASKNVPLRIDPILEPIGFGFAQSLDRYRQARKRWPEIEMMMGIGNISELTDVDSAGINLLLLAICQELGVRSVLTTQVINWARSSVKECDIARRIVHHAIHENVPPKHLSTELVVLRDPKLLEYSFEELATLASEIRDHNYRIFSSGGQVHLLGSRQHFHDEDPFEVFDSLMDSQPKNVDASHAFYLGFEMCKAMIAGQLGKNYTQDQSLDWGHLTVDEKDRHRLRRRRDQSPSESTDQSPTRENQPPSAPNDAT